MGDSFYNVDNLLDITDEEIGGFIGGSYPENLEIPFEVGCIFSVDNFYDIHWIPDFMKDSGKPKVQTSLGTAMVEEHYPEMNSDDVISSSVTSDSEFSRSRFEKKYIPTSGILARKPRSKRSRTPHCKWASRPISDITSSATENGYNTSLSANGSGCSHEEESQSSMKFTITKQGMKSIEEELSEVRTCRHCGVNKTPQWRCGPLGPKTLCNACGVRYKTGRLFPEYRPAASPTFSAEKHSNSHKVVMEMRRQKELICTET